MENIKALWSRLLTGNKNEIITILSKEYGISESSVRTNWFSSWKIPEHCQARLVELLVNALKVQSLKTKKIIDD